MELQVNGAKTYCYTGGKAFDAAKPTVVFVHGALNDHSVWALQSRYMANHGWNVLAVDLPGHCRSQGEAPSTVEEAAEFIVALADAAGVQRLALVGHSMGALIALEAAGRLKDRVTHLVLIGIAYPMRVSPALLEASLKDPIRALEMDNVFSRSTLAAPPSLLGPGTWVYGVNMALGRRVLASNPGADLYYRDFKACDSYTGALEAVSALTCPVLFLLGAVDQMTPPKGAQALIDLAKQTGKTVKIAYVPVGHRQMSEAPDETLFAIQGFLAS